MVRLRPATSNTQEMTTIFVNPRRSIKAVPNGAATATIMKRAPIIAETSVIDQPKASMIGSIKIAGVLIAEDENIRRINEINVAQTLKEIRRALIDSDVAYKTAKELLLLDTQHREWGARPLRRNIQNLIENPISEMFISGKFKDVDATINVKASKGNFVFSQSFNKTIKKKKNTAKNTVKKSEVN